MSHFEKKHNLIIVAVVAYLLLGLSLSYFGFSYLNLFQYIPVNPQSSNIQWEIAALLSIYVLYLVYVELKEKRGYK